MPRKHKKASARSAPRAGSWERRPLGDLVRENPKLLHVLHRHGVHFCSGCYITLLSEPRKAAAYHAVTDIERFLSDFAAAMPSPRRRR